MPHESTNEDICSASPPGAYQGVGHSLPQTSREDQREAPHNDPCQQAPQCPGESTCEDLPDLLPENCHYRDEGCELAPSCLSCPFERCAYDQPGGPKRLFNEYRNARILSLHHAGLKTAQLGRMFCLSQRSIQRIISAEGYHD